MKKIFFVVLTIIFAFIFSACSSNNTVSTSKDSLETQYYEYAQNCVDDGNIEKAIEVLTEGIEKTKSAKLTEMLEKLETSQKENSSENNNTSENAVIEYGKVSGLDFSYWNNSSFTNSNNLMAEITFYEVNDLYLQFSIGVDNGSEFMYQREIDLRDCQASWKGHYNDGIATYTYESLTLTFTFNTDGTLTVSESGTSPFSTSLAGQYKR